MGTFFRDGNGNTVGLCPDCKRIKPETHFRKRRDRTAQFISCYDCEYDRSVARHRLGQEERHRILQAAGRCMWPDCHLRYPQDHRGNFELDHIDPRLKQHERELDAVWISGHVQEFRMRVEPNLQVLCRHHNLVKRNLEYGKGGFMYKTPWEEQSDASFVDLNDLTPQLPGFEDVFSDPLT